jgi:5-methyltetrahydropteroyltriglutamate--homocysteine methyltransferase
VAAALLCDPTICAQVKALGGDPDRFVDLYVEAINEAVADCPADVIIGVHMCRGNFKGRYLGAGSYEPVAERFFARTNVSHYLLEYDTNRAGDFAPLRFVPKGKGVVLGLISSKSPILESLNALKKRIEEAARYLDIDRLGIAPQCGFASTVAGNPMTETDEEAKLALVVRAARSLWASASQG